MSVGQFAWHIHDDKLVEVLTEPIEARQEYIRLKKPQDEIETRLRLLKPVVGELPAAVIDAGLAVTKERGWDSYAWMDMYNALRTHASEINTLHAQECPDCPWDGKTIFPGR